MIIKYDAFGLTASRPVLCPSPSRSSADSAVLQQVLVADRWRRRPTASAANRRPFFQSVIGGCLHPKHGCNWCLCGCCSPVRQVCVEVIFLSTLSPRLQLKHVTDLLFCDLDDNTLRRTGRRLLLIIRTKLMNPPLLCVLFFQKWKRYFTITRKWCFSRDLKNNYAVILLYVVYVLNQFLQSHKYIWRFTPQLLRVHK